jgi:hypothetical protein
MAVECRNGARPLEREPLHEREDAAACKEAATTDVHEL